MKAITIPQYTTDAVTLSNMPMPQVNDNDVLVEIHAASINPIDLKTKEGHMKILLKYQFPLILGNDFSGVVTAIGKNVTHFKIGDEVYGRPRKSRIGTFAEYIAVHEDDLALKPQNLNFVEAASLPLVALTSYQALNDVLKLQKGQKVFIQAGAGGIGTFAIQLAKTMGLYVATTVSDKGYDLVKQLGADKIINYKKEKFDAVLKDYDGVFDTLGNQAVKDAFKIVKKGGGIVSITALPNYRFYKTYKDQYHLTFLHRILFFFTGLPFYFLEKKYNVTYTQLFMAPSRTQLTFIKEFVEQGKIKPIIDQVFSLEDAQKALDYVKTGRAKGKVILQVR